MAATAASEHVRTRLWRAGFGGTLTLSMALGLLPAFALGALAPFIVADLGLSRSRLGMLTTVLFLVGGAASPLLGRLTDTLGARRLTVAQFVVSSLALVLLATAPVYGLMLAAVGVAGLAMAVSNPATNKLVAVHASPGRRGLLMGVKQSGVQVGALVAGAALPTGALLLGWRRVLVASALLGLVGVAATLGLVPGDPPPRGAAPRRQRPPLPTVVAPLSAYALLMGAGLASVGAYLPLFAVEALGLSPARAGLAAGLVGGIGVVARISWARATESFSHPGTALVLLAGGAVVAAALLAAAVDGDARLLWIAAATVGATGAAWNAVGMLALVDQTDHAEAGRASGVVLLAFYTGFVVSPVAFGAWVDATGRYDLAWTGVLLAFAAAALVAWRWRQAAMTSLPSG